MKVVQPSIVWINKKYTCRILSVDFHPFTNQLAVAGTQTRQQQMHHQTDQLIRGCIKIWQINQSNPSKPDFQYGIPQALETVNVVKYSPNGRYLASGSDSQRIQIWVVKNAPNIGEGFNKGSRRRWAEHIPLGGHTNDITDMAWSKDSKYLVTSGMDGRTILHYIEGKSQKFSTGDQHKNIQGVALDPLLRYYVSMSNDQVARVHVKIKNHAASSSLLAYNTHTLKQYCHRVNGSQGVEEGFQEQEQDEENWNGVGSEKEEQMGIDIGTGTGVNHNPNPTPKKDFKFNMFANESICTFFRRPSISPDGQLFLLPTGIWKNPPVYNNPNPQTTLCTQIPIQQPIIQQPAAICCAYLFRRNYYDKPSFVVQSNGQPVLVCRFCPKLFKKTNPSQGLFKQDYFMVFAIATTNSVIIYSTEDMKPLHGFGNFHYAALTDLSWKDDKMLAVSSSDGYLTFATFAPGQFGEDYVVPEDGSAQLKQLTTKVQYVPPQKKQGNGVATNTASQSLQPNLNQPVVLQEQKTMIIPTSNGVKKKIVPRIMSRPELQEQHMQ